MSKRYRFYGNTSWSVIQDATMIIKELDIPEDLTITWSAMENQDGIRVAITATGAAVFFTFHETNIIGAKIVDVDVTDNGLESMFKMKLVYSDGIIDRKDTDYLAPYRMALQMAIMQ